MDSQETNFPWNRLGFQAQIEDLRLKCSILGETLKKMEGVFEKEVADSTYKSTV